MAIASFLSGCGGSDPDPIVEPPVVFATVQGTVRGTDGTAVSGVHVDIAGVTADTDASGHYSVQVDNATPNTTARFTKSGFASQVRPVRSLQSQGQQVVDATLNAVTATTSFNPAASATLTVTGSTAQVTLAANALVRSNGTAATGPANAQITLLDASQATGVMPGDYLASNGNATQPIESNGAIQVEFSDADGSKLQLASGQTATIRIPAVKRGLSTLPATIALYYLDETSGLWVQDGSATLQGTAPSQYYEGTVTHFTAWNADKPYDTVYINGCVQDSGGTRITSGAFVLGEGVDYIGKSYATVDSAGNFRMAVKKSATTRLFGQQMIPARYSATADVAVADVDITMSGCLVLNKDGFAPVLGFPPVSEPPPPPPVGAYAGHYTGTFSGTETGTFDVNISDTGRVSGSGHSTTYNLDFVVNGTVAAGGALSLDAASGTAGASLFSGNIDVTTGVVTGTWRYVTTPVSSTNGTFSGNKVPPSR
ncbi:carboxypeptidase-like regulatory domain-containing protein [Piscinibacter terrae]|uniref:Carboxypeptidase regulatory-like domain-containing protein n=1 Tax=Piscinibacter terrae TaxID=2496871 RepID=A0A3N7HMW9_9BURK|nr:carboxypeptidase-like regulatory domain-containing protein [Albitalea terrae]RQP22426.1 carboxypeptidase regulatory-like domain-containing protein [Albitalea terrae]